MEAQRIVPWIVFLLYLIAGVWLTRLHVALPFGLGRLSLFWKAWCIWMALHFLFIQPIVDFDQVGTFAKCTESCMFLGLKCAVDRLSTLPRSRSSANRSFPGGLRTSFGS